MEESYLPEKEILQPLMIVKFRMERISVKMKLQDGKSTQRDKLEIQTRDVDRVKPTPVMWTSTKEIPPPKH